MAINWQTAKDEWVNITSWWFMAIVGFICVMSAIMCLLYGPTPLPAWTIIYGNTLIGILTIAFLLLWWQLLDFFYEKLFSKRSETTG